MDPDELAGTRPSAEAPERALGVVLVDERWAPRLVVVAVALATTIGLTVIGALINALAYDGGGIGIMSDLVRHQRLRSFLQVANLATGALVLLGGLAVAGARYLGDDRRWARLAVFGAASAIAAFALVGALTDLLWDDHLPGIDNAGSALLERFATLGLALVGGWLTDAWLPEGAPE